jgi:hypothetical protein
MELTSAGKIERLPREQVKLTIELGNRVKYTGWFTLYNLIKYDMILGKDWMEQVKHDIDHTTNTLTIYPRNDINPFPVRLRGLARDQGRNGTIAKEGGEEEKDIELMVVETVIGRIDTHWTGNEHSNENDGPPPITACRELHSTRYTQPVSNRTRQLARLTPAESVLQLFLAEIDLFPVEENSGKTDMDKKIRKEYADLFREPEGLPPHRPRFGEAICRERSHSSKSITICSTSIIRT